MRFAPRARFTTPVFARVQHAGRGQSAEKRIQLFRRKRDMEFFLSTPSNDLELSFPVELLGNEMGLFRKAIKPAPDRVLNDEDRALSSHLLADGQIPAKSRET